MPLDLAGHPAAALREEALDGVAYAEAERGAWRLLRQLANEHVRVLPHVDQIAPSIYLPIGETHLVRCLDEPLTLDEHRAPARAVGDLFGVPVLRDPCRIPALDALNAAQGVLHLHAVAKFEARLVISLGLGVGRRPADCTVIVDAAKGERVATVEQPDLVRQRNLPQGHGVVSHRDHPEPELALVIAENAIAHLEAELQSIVVITVCSWRSLHGRLYRHTRRGGPTCRLGLVVAVDDAVKLGVVDGHLCRSHAEIE